MLLTMLAALAATPQNVTITQIDWDMSGAERSDFFLDMLAAVDPTDPAQLANEMNHQPLAHFGRSDLFAAYSGFHSRQTCSRDETILSRADLLARAAQTRVVIINEAHSAPWHRATTADLLGSLRELGFTHFAAETFARQGPGGEDPIETSTAAYARRGEGTYFEPVFGMLVREAKALGYQMVAYEEPHDASTFDLPRKEQIRRREAAQAAELARLLEADPDARILVHVGHGHVREEPVDQGDGTSEKWMAARLKDATGIDPLTISQTNCSGAAGSGNRIIEVPEDIRGDVGVDLSIETAPEDDFRVRPEGAMEVRIPPSWRTGDGWTLVEARRADEPDDAIPVDHLAVHATETDTKVLYLPPGEYRIRLRPIAPTEGPPGMMVVSH